MSVFHQGANEEKESINTSHQICTQTCTVERKKTLADEQEAWS